MGLGTSKIGRVAPENQDLESFPAHKNLLLNYLSIPPAATMSLNNPPEDDSSGPDRPHSTIVTFTGSMLEEECDTDHSLTARSNMHSIRRCSTTGGGHSTGSLSYMTYASSEEVSEATTMRSSEARRYNYPRDSFIRPRPKPSERVMIHFRDKNILSRRAKPSKPRPSSIEESSVQPQESFPKIRKWQIFPGNNRFYYDGRLITGPDRLVFHLSFFMLNLVFGMFSYFALPSETFDFEPHWYVRVVLIAITALLYVVCVCNMLYTALVDPGIIPRGTKADVEFVMKKYSSNTYPTGFAPFIREYVNGKQVTRRWCQTCLHYRPPRSTHCRVCNNCVERFDHHCPFVGNCVGQRNYPSFFWFVVGIVLSGIHIVSLCIVDIVFRCLNSKDIEEALNNYTAICVMCTTLLALASWGPVTFLCCLHLQLCSHDSTTNEDIKKTNSNNPYDRGTICKNCMHVLGGPRYPSLIGRRDFVTQEWIQTLEYSDAVEEALIRKYGPNYRNMRGNARSSNSRSSKSGKRSSYVSKSRTTANRSEDGDEDEQRPSTSRKGQGNNNLQFAFSHENYLPSLMQPDNFKFERASKTETQVEIELATVRSESDNFSTQGAAGDFGFYKDDDAITITDEEGEGTSTNLEMLVHSNNPRRSTPTSASGYLNISPPHSPLTNSHNGIIQRIRNHNVWDLLFYPTYNRDVS